MTQKNFIKVAPLGTTEGTVTDVTTNVFPVVVAAIAHSAVLNAENTTQVGETIIQSRESQAVVAAEIRRYLDRELGEGNYEVSNGQIFEW